MKTKKLLLILSLSFGIILSGCNLISTEEDNNLGVANPASIYCEENGGTLELIFDNGENIGICHFQDGSFCEERDFYNGDCKPKTNKLIPTQTGEEINNVNDFISCLQAGNIILESYPRKCTTKDGKTFIEEIEDEIMCTTDTKQCPDGSWVSRSGPDCKFSQCPEIQKDTSEGKNLTDLIKEHKENKSESGLNEDDIDLMNTIIEKLK